MFKRSLLIGLVLMIGGLTGCVAAPYKKASALYSSGYQERKMQDGQWWVIYESRRPIQYERARELAAKRAYEVCEGDFIYLPDFPYDLEYAALRSCDSHAYAPCSTTLAQIWVQCKHNNGFNSDAGKAGAG